MSKGGAPGVAEDFYPFVNNGAEAAEGALIPRHPARIAVYDDASAAPRVVLVEPKGVREYLEEITLQVTQLAQAQGGSIPFMVIREIVENLIHAYFIQPTVSILDHGNTIRFSDQGPGIRQKDRALQYGTTSATEEMRRYIRGVGSGLPYVQQYMYDKGGSLLIEDNMSGGTVITLTAHAPSMPAPQGAVPPQGAMASQQGMYQQAWMPQQPSYQQEYAQNTSYGGMPGMSYGAMQGWQQGAPTAWGGPQGWQGQAPQGQMPWQQQQGWQQQQQQQQGWQQPFPAQQQMPQPSPAPQAAASPAWPAVSSRGQAVLAYLCTHESVGPSDLARTQGGSQPTWTRELQTLEDQGFVRKDGQKRRLTAMGQAYVQQTGLVT